MKAILIALSIMSLTLITMGFLMAFLGTANNGVPCNSLNAAYPFLILMIGLLLLIIVFIIGNILKRDNRNKVTA